MQDLRSEWELVNEREIKLIKIKPNLVISNASVIKDCAKNGLGLALLADWTIQADLINGSLMKILPEWQVMGVGLGNRVWLVLPSKSFVPKKTKVLSDFLIEKIQ